MNRSAILIVLLLASITTFGQNERMDVYKLEKKFIDEVKIFEISKGDTITRFYDWEKDGRNQKKKVVTYTGTYELFSETRTGNIEIRKDNKLLLLLPKGNLIFPDSTEYKLRKDIIKGSSQWRHTYVSNEKDMVAFRFLYDGKLRSLEITYYEPIPADHNEILDLLIKDAAGREAFRKSAMPAYIILMILFFGSWYV